MEDFCYCEQDKVAHANNFDKWFAKIRNRFHPAIPCYLNYNDHDDPNCDMAYYEPLQHWHLFHKDVIAPEECPYILEHTVSK